MSKKGTFFHIEGIVLESSDRTELHISSSIDTTYDDRTGWQQVPAIKSVNIGTTLVWVRLSDGREVKISFPGEVPVRKGHKIVVVYYYINKKDVNIVAVINENTRLIQEFHLLGDIGCLYHSIIMVCCFGFVIGVVGLFLSFLIPNRILWIKTCLVSIVPMFIFLASERIRKMNFDAARSEYIRSITG